jgi:ParB-like chromosome segregation protein Spo0J
VEAHRQVPPAKLDERYASLRLGRPELVATVRRSVEREGVLNPLVANLLPDGTLALLDGFKRLRVVRDLEHELVPVRIVHLGEQAALAAILTYNAPHSGLSELEEAWVIRSLVRGCKLQQKQVAELLGRHKSWVCRRLLLAERLVDSVQQDMRLGLCSATMAREIVRLPRGNQAMVARVVRQHGLTSRQCAALVEVCLSCDKLDTLSAVLDDPLRFIGKDVDGAERKAPRDPRLSEQGEAVRSRIVRLERAAVQVSQVLRQHPALSMEATDLSVLAPLSEPVAAHSRQAADQLGELGLAAEPATGAEVKA